MTSWSAKRRFLYGGSVLVALALISSAIFFKLLYKAPTCSDGSQNGDERGIDCGGACKNLCTSDTLAPVVIWSKVFNISGDVYSAVAYIENPNINSKNPKATYQFKIYDSNNQLLTIKEGQTNIPKNKKFAVFETGIVLKGSKPTGAEFSFLSFSPWQKDAEKEPDISLRYGTLIATTSVPRIDGVISNNSLISIPQLELAVFVIDGKENVMAASRTFIDNLRARSSQDFVFTWPKTFSLGVQACINPLDIVLVLDRSGSMKSESVVPPEPFTTVKKTAQDFIINLTDSDQVSVISFGDNAREESSLSGNKKASITAIDNFFLSTSTLEQTNIADGLTKAWSELSSTTNTERKKAIILLTDGAPTEPKQAGSNDYPIVSAQAVAQRIMSSGVRIFTIGLGKSINEGFLKSIATADSDYFPAPSKETLKAVYDSITSNLCIKKPSLINVIYRQI